MSAEPTRTALVVEDDETVQEFLEAILTALGFQVFRRTNGRDFLEFVDALDPDLVLLDLGLPDRDGMALLEELRASSRQADVPVIVITGNDSTEALSRTLSAGADAYILKPISAEELRWRIKGLLRLNRYRRGMQQAEARLRAEQDRAGLEAILREFSETSGTLLVVLDPDGRVVECNPAFQERYLRTSGSFLDSVHPGNGAVFETTLERTQAPNASPLSLSGSLIERGGASIPVQGMAVRRDTSQEGAQTLLLLSEVRPRDITDQLLDQLSMSEEFIHLAAGAAHDLRNLLGVVAMQTELLDLDPSQAEVTLAVANLRDIYREARQLTDLLTSQMQYSPDQERWSDLVAAVEDSRVYLRTALPRRISLDLEIANELRLREEPAKVSMDRVDIRRCLLNLLVNARDAIRGTGAISIRVRTSPTSPTLVVLEVTDSGIGIASDILPRIFQPLFTTKPGGAGTGLGLPIVQGLVVKAGGTIEVESKVGEGTQFRIYLPLVVKADRPLELSAVEH